MIKSESIDKQKTIAQSKSCARIGFSIKENCSLFHFLLFLCVAVRQSCIEVQLRSLFDGLCHMNDLQNYRGKKIQERKPTH